MAVKPNLRRHDRRTTEGKLGAIQLKLRLMSENLARVLAETCRELDVIDKELEELICTKSSSQPGSIPSPKSKLKLLPFTQWQSNSKPKKTRTVRTKSSSVAQAPVVTK
jgi:hypothetical protein